MTAQCLALAKESMTGRKERVHGIMNGRSSRRHTTVGGAALTTLVCKLCVYVVRYYIEKVQWNWRLAFESFVLTLTKSLIFIDPGLLGLDSSRIPLGVRPPRGSHRPTGC